MIAVYNDSGIPEKESKRRYFFPEGIMMENAAAALEKEVVTYVTGCAGNINSACITTASGVTNSSAANSSVAYNTYAHTSNTTVANVTYAGEHKILILCGSGNNGGDGLALARRLAGTLTCHIYLTATPKTDEAKQQLKMAQAAGVTFIQNPLEKLEQYSVIVDCIFGTGFHGELPSEITELFSKINETNAYRIACDIPSGLGFNANCTVTMGALKSALFTDKAKNCTGKIKVANLGISSKLFEDCSKPDMFLIEESDIKLPLRRNPASHKGTYGHTAVIAGEKSGAAVIAATAALNFGSGLVTLVKAENSNLEQFKISPELMISNEIPANTTCVQIGSGLGRELTAAKEELTTVSQQLTKTEPQLTAATEVNRPTTPNIITKFLNWFKTTKNPACVLDADIFYYKDFPALLAELNSVPNAKIIMTPHPKELLEIVQTLTSAGILHNLEDITSVTKAAEQRQKIGAEVTARLENVTIVMKSANTVICCGQGNTSEFLETNSQETEVAEVNRPSGRQTAAAEVNRTSGCQTAAAEVNRTSGCQTAATEVNRTNGCQTAVPEVNRTNGCQTAVPEVNRTIGCQTAVPEVNHSNGRQTAAAEVNCTIGCQTAATEITSPKPRPAYLIAHGTPALAKAGSGDVLAGMNSALLAQGYTAKDAAITATEAHALASSLQKNKGQAFDLTPEKLIENLAEL